MYVEQLVLENFRCFGPDRTFVPLARGVTALVGANGSGKTAAFQALVRLFGVTGDQRRVRRSDFHVPATEEVALVQRRLVVEAILAFPELGADGELQGSAVPEFFRHMAADASGALKCRIRLDATWSDDGSAEGTIEERRRVITTLDDPFDDSACVDLKATDRARVQVVYVPALRDASSQVTAFLRGRLWRAVNWSTQTRAVYRDTGEALRGAFATEPGVATVEAALGARWAQLHAAGTDTTPLLRPMENRFDGFVRKSELVFRPDEAGRDRAVEDLSDGQRSLLHIALVAAALDVERQIPDLDASHFDAGAVALPALTIVAVEEPENNLSPFYLARIVRQLEDVASSHGGQALVSSHSAGMLRRIPPEHVRYFRLKPGDRTAVVRSVRLPEGDEDASKFIREAVHIYPELYFARFVVLGEGSTEAVVLPKLADAMGLAVDPSFVAIVPLGGRHVHHLWRLLTDLDIPYATLLDLDDGRAGGGWGRIKTAYTELLAIGVPPAALFGHDLAGDALGAALRAVGERGRTDRNALLTEVRRLRQFGLFYSEPLDLDWSMLRAFPAAYRVREDGMAGPSSVGDAKSTVLGVGGSPALYDDAEDEDFRWYRYLFTGRGKPSTHVRVLRTIADAQLRDGAPEELRALLARVVSSLHGPESAGRC